jgi:hypothetical protein
MIRVFIANSDTVDLFVSVFDNSNGTIIPWPEGIQEKIPVMESQINAGAVVAVDVVEDANGYCPSTL